LLDEPTRSLDPGGTWRLWQLLRRTAEHGTSILLATHNFEEAATIGQHVIVLRQGEVAAERRVGHQTSMDDLRSFYFREIEPEAAGVPGEVG
jgi:ABC-2 type transport system ATP-binding protein